MKVFLSWSGTRSHRVACILRDWLPSVIQALTPYVSSEDIDKGTRWSTDIAEELEASSYGIVCLTPENLVAPWVHFEAGALSKSLEKTNVVPFLFGVKRSEVHGPLLQFQSVINEPDDIEKLLSGLNDRLEASERLSGAALGKAFRVWYPHLVEQLDALLASESEGTEEGMRLGIGDEAPLLEEILELARTQQRILASFDPPRPTMRLPSPPGEGVLSESLKLSKMAVECLEGMADKFSELGDALAEVAGQRPELLGLAKLAKAEWTGAHFNIGYLESGFAKLVEQEEERDKSFGSRLRQMWPALWE